MAGQGRAGSCVGVEGIGLALAASPGPVGTVDLGHLDPGILQGAGQSGAVGAGALDPGAEYRPEALCPLHCQVVAGRAGGELRVSHGCSGLAERGEVDGVQMGVGADDDGPRCCHDGEVPSAGHNRH